MFKYFKHISPAQSVLDQRHKDVREQFMQRVAAEASLVSVCYAGKWQENDVQLTLKNYILHLIP